MIGMPRSLLVGWLFLFIPQTALLSDLVFSQSQERIIFDESFEQGLDHWEVEDRGRNHLIELKDGKLIIRNRTETPGIFVWNRISLPKSFRLEFDFCPLGRGGKKEGFFLLFLGAKGIDGSEIFDDSLWEGSQLEDFGKYTKGKIRCYHIGYLRGETGLCNLRKNPGLNLVQSNTVPILIEGETYRIVVEKRNARLTMRIRGAGISSDKELFQNWTDSAVDSPVLDGGHFGFRQIAYDTGVVGAYDNVRLTDLEP
ncbi:MAG: DUF1961 family protein [bacterium]